MRRPTEARSICWIFLLAVTVFAIVFILHFGGAVIANNPRPTSDIWSLLRVQADAPVAPPRAMVVRGSSPETDRVAALFAVTGLFDVFVSPLDDRWARTGDKIYLENSENCRSDAQTLFLGSIKLECIHHAEPSSLPGCSLQVSLFGAPDSEIVAQRARIYVVLDHGEPCPFYDQRYLSDDLRMNGLRPWGSSKLLADLTSPTVRTILRAIGIEPNSHGR